MIIRFRALWSICISSFLVLFKNGPEYITNSTAQVFITLTRSLLKSFISSSFLILQRYVFLIFSFNYICLMVSASNISKYLQVFCFPRFLILSWFGSSIPSISFRLPLFITSKCQIPSLCSDCILSLHVLKFPVIFSFFANSLTSSMYIRWLIFPCNLLSLYPAVYFQCMWLSGIIVITNCNGDSASPLNIIIIMFIIIVTAASDSNFNIKVYIKTRKCRKQEIISV